MLERVKIVVFEEKCFSDDDPSVKVFTFTKEPLARECYDMCVTKLKNNSEDYEEGMSTFDCLETGSKVYMYEDSVDSEDFRMEIGE